MRTFVETVAAIVLCGIFFVIGMNAAETEGQKKDQAAYDKGYKDALYKRPASEDLELVCAGLWLSQLKSGEQ